MSVVGRDGQAGPVGSTSPAVQGRRRPSESLPTWVEFALGTPVPTCTGQEAGQGTSDLPPDVLALMGHRLSWAESR